MALQFSRALRRLATVPLYRSTAHGARLATTQASEGLKQTQIVLELRNIVRFVLFSLSLLQRRSFPVTWSRRLVWSGKTGGAHAREGGDSY